MSGGLELHAKEAIFDGAGEILAPGFKNLKAWHYCRKNEEYTIHNFAPDGADGSITGAPVYFETYVAFRSSDAFMTISAGETDSFTWLCAARNNDTLADVAHRPVYMGNYNGSSGASIYVNAVGGGLPAGASNAQAYSAAAVNNARSFAETDVNQFNFYGLTYNAAAPSLLFKNYSENIGDDTPAVLSTDRTGKNGALLRVGAAYGSFGGQSYVSFAGVWDRVLTEEEILAVKAIVAYDLMQETPPLVLA